jgi:hypothetical protein
MAQLHPSCKSPTTSRSGAKYGQAPQGPLRETLRGRKRLADGGKGSGCINQAPYPPARKRPAKAKGDEFPCPAFR